METIKILCETSSRPAGTESFQHRGGIQLVWIKSAADQQAGDGSQAGRPGLALRCPGPPRAPTAAQPGPRQGHCRPRPRWRLVRAAVLCGRPSRAGLASGSVTAGSGFLETWSVFVGLLGRSRLSGQQAAEVTYGERRGSSGSPAVQVCEDPARPPWSRVVEPSRFE